jgi:hypothetical protein
LRAQNKEDIPQLIRNTLMDARNEQAFEEAWLSVKRKMSRGEEKYIRENWIKKKEHWARCYLC